MTDPLPCPFCGTQPTVYEARNNAESFIVRCMANYQDEGPGCTVSPHTAWYLPMDGKDGRTRAIEAWNTRNSDVGKGDTEVGR